MHENLYCDFNLSSNNRYQDGGDDDFIASSDRDIDVADEEESGRLTGSGEESDDVIPRASAPPAGRGNFGDGSSINNQQDSAGGADVYSRTNKRRIIDSDEDKQNQEEHSLQFYYFI